MKSNLHNNYRKEEADLEREDRTKNQRKNLRLVDKTKDRDSKIVKTRKSKNRRDKGSLGESLLNKNRSKKSTQLTGLFITSNLRVASVNQTRTTATFTRVSKVNNSRFYLFSIQSTQTRNWTWRRSMPKSSIFICKNCRLRKRAPFTCRTRTFGRISGATWLLWILQASPPW